MRAVVAIIVVSILEYFTLAILFEVKKIIENLLSPCYSTSKTIILKFKSNYSIL